MLASPFGITNQVCMSECFCAHYLLLNQRINFGGRGSHSNVSTLSDIQMNTFGDIKKKNNNSTHTRMKAFMSAFTVIPTSPTIITPAYPAFFRERKQAFTATPISLNSEVATKAANLLMLLSLDIDGHVRASFCTAD